MRKGDLSVTAFFLIFLFFALSFAILFVNSTDYWPANLQGKTPGSSRRIPSLPCTIRTSSVKTPNLPVGPFRVRSQ
ncbi:hypothetical protein V8F06_011486 [Rhypophila decipiens]